MEIFCSVGTILNSWLSFGFGTETSVPVVPLYRFWYPGSGSYFLIPGFRCKVFKGFICICLILLLVWFHFGTIPVLNQVIGT